MAKKQEKLPRPAAELEELADYYDTNDTSAEMDTGQWVDPRPMVTTSLRLPDTVVAALKAEAQQDGVRYTALVRRVLESHLDHHEDAVRLSGLEQRMDHLTSLVQQLIEKSVEADSTPRRAVRVACEIPNSDHTSHV